MRIMDCCFRKTAPRAQGGGTMKRAFKLLLFCASISVVLFSSACSSSPLPIYVALSPTFPQRDQGQSVTITANLTNDTKNEGVKWSLQGPGTISDETTSTVTYTAPASVSSPETATLAAVSVAQLAATASTQITVNPPPSISLALKLPSGTTNVGYDQSIAVSGGTAPFLWSLPIGTLPYGLSLNAGTGAITGSPRQAGTWYFAAQVTDAEGLSSHDGLLSLEIHPNAPPGYPVPFLEQPVVPDAGAPGGTGFSLTVNGAGFVPGATVDFNGKPLATRFVSRDRLTATVPASDIASAGTATITAVNPTPGGGSSNAVSFPIATPEGTPDFTEPPGSPIPLAGISPSSIAVGDFSGDGTPDVAVAGLDQVFVFLDLGSGAFAAAPGSPFYLPYPPWDTFPTPYAGPAALGDFDNSGRLGLAVGNRQNMNVTVLLGGGTGSLALAPAFAYADGLPTNALAAGDFNGDGNLDLAAGNYFLGQSLVVLLGGGDGAFNQAPPSPAVLPVSPNCMAPGDFNGDGKLDLAVAGVTNQSTLQGAVAILLGNGDGTFNAATASPIDLGNDPTAIAAADLNGDGKTDLAIANQGDNTVTILLGNGDGTFTEAPGSPLAVGNGPDALAVGDFTGNGKLDLAVSNGQSGTITILLGNGDGTFTEAADSPLTFGSAGGPLAVGDFSGSGRLGLAVASHEGLTILLQP